MMNYYLARAKGLSHATIVEIENLHKVREELEELRVHKLIPKSEFQLRWTQNEFNLQRLWGFTEDSRLHAFWRSPRCTCPKLDNEDLYGVGYYVQSGDCPLHGEE
jgi:hypothetical protein